MEQFALTVAAGKRLIAKATAAHPAVQSALTAGAVLILGGTTNGYVAEEILMRLGQAEGFVRNRFFRGITLPPGQPPAGKRTPLNGAAFAGDVFIVNGVWQKRKGISDVVGSLKEGDVIIKGANALDLARRRAAVLIGHPAGGTTALALQAVVGQRVRLLVPIGLEKRVAGDLDSLAALVNAPGAKGPRLLPVPGEVLTEIEAIRLLTGATAELVAAGGVCGAEGAVWLAVGGEPAQKEAARKLIESIAGEPPFAL